MKTTASTSKSDRAMRGIIRSAASSFRRAVRVRALSRLRCCLVLRRVRLAILR
ncbi:MAG: hypothetical protein AAB263_14120 [Planctomycetota bacterium]